MKLRRKLVLALTALLVAAPLTVVSSASAEEAAESCRPVDTRNPTGGAYISGQLCWTARGDGWYNMTWDVDVWDEALDDSGAAAQIKYTTIFGVDSRAYRVDGLGAGARFLSGYNNGKGLYMRACLINGDSVHDCGAWK